jgi:hypothetical protein
MNVMIPDTHGKSLDTLQIDKDIIMELKNEPDEIELLLLGACESGKSTFLKQVNKKFYTSSDTKKGAIVL